MTDDDRDLDALTRDLARYRSVGAPVTLRSRVRAEIMAAPFAPHTAPRASWLVRLRPLLATLAVVAVLAGAGGAAAAESLPGDPAFGIKRAVEDAQVEFATDDTARLDVLTGLLDRRLAELEIVAAQRPNAVGVAVAEYESALARVERRLSVVAGQHPTAARDGAIARATAAAQDHIARLRALEGTLPAAALPGIERAVDAQQRIRGNDRRPAAPQAPAASGAPPSPSRPGVRPTTTSPRTGTR